MMKKPLATNFTFTPLGYLLYNGTLALGLLLMLTRNNAAFWDGLPWIGQFGVGSHASNLGLA